MSVILRSKVMYQLPVKTAEGEFALGYSERGLCSLRFPGTGAVPASATRPPERVLRWHASATEALLKTLSGQPARVMPPFDLESGTAFQRQVWAELQKLSIGQTLTYGAIARVLGKPGASRAVGTACGRNPIPVLVPCHRVLAANNKLGGFSGGIEWKRALLGRENVSVAPR